MAGAIRTIFTKTATNGKLLRPLIPSVYRVATLISVNSPFALPPRPEPRRSKRFRFFEDMFFDCPWTRFDENSRVIVVEGNVGSGKHEFAKKIAEEFGMLYIPDVDFNKIYNLQEKLDPSLHHLEINKLFSENVYLSLEDVLLSENLRKEKFYINSQLQMLKCRFLSYLNGQKNLFTTGQGMVIVRSPYSDNLFLNSLWDMGLIKNKDYESYDHIYDVLFTKLWAPHLVIHMDASIEYCLESIRKRNIPYEVNSPILNREFLENFDYHFEHTYMKELRNLCELITVDPADPPEWDLFVEDLESRELMEEEYQAGKSQKFYHWNKNHKKQWNIYQQFLDDEIAHEALFYMKKSIHCINQPLMSKEDFSILLESNKDHDGLGDIGDCFKPKDIWRTLRADKNIVKA